MTGYGFHVELCLKIPFKLSAQAANGLFTDDGSTRWTTQSLSLILISFLNCQHASTDTLFKLKEDNLYSLPGLL